jgi:hypothetical protein
MPDATRNGGMELADGSRTDPPGFFDILWVGAPAYTTVGGLWLAISSRAWGPLAFAIVPLILVATNSAYADGVIGGFRKVVLRSSVVALIALTGVTVFDAWYWHEEGANWPGLLSHDYRGGYSATKHRLFKVSCAGRGDISTKSVDGTTYARCGALFPDVLMLAASAAEYAQADEATKNDRPEDPIVIPASER